MLWYGTIQYHYHIISIIDYFAKLLKNILAYFCHIVHRLLEESRTRTVMRPHHQLCCVIGSGLFGQRKNKDDVKSCSLGKR